MGGKLGTLAVLGAVALSTGCSTMAGTGALAGGGIGAGVGSLVGAATGNTAAGAAVGTALGAGVGAAVGADADSRERERADIRRVQAESQPVRGPMSVDDVIAMCRPGPTGTRPADETIIEYIRTSGSRFDLQPADIRMLTDNGVPDPVVRAMMNAKFAPPAVVRRSQRTVIVDDPVVVYERPWYYRPYYAPPPPLASDVASPTPSGYRPGMSAAPAIAAAFDPVAFARRVLHAEADALHLVAGRLSDSFATVLDALDGCRGRVAVVGVGKSADVGRKLVGTLNSTGTRAYLLDATRAVHGDLGMVHPDDVALLLSHSGESEELVRLIGPLRGLCGKLVAVTGADASTLARQSDAAIVYGPITEACPLALAPSTSTTVMIAVGDALAFGLSERRQFTPEQFAKFHPAGSLGRKLATVEQHMRRGAEVRFASAEATVREVFATVRNVGRRTGAVMLLEPDGSLAGLFTDSDLARLFEARSDGAFDRPIREVMTAKPLTIRRTARLLEAFDTLRARKFSELPVLDEDGRPVGLLDITDLIGLDPAADARPALKVV